VELSHRRSSFCGTFRDRALAGAVPWHYQARCPLVPCLEGGDYGVRTFLPRRAFQHSASDRPAHPPRIFYREMRKRGEKKKPLHRRDTEGALANKKRSD